MVDQCLLGGKKEEVDFKETQRNIQCNANLSMSISVMLTTWVCISILV